MDAGFNFIKQAGESRQSRYLSFESEFKFAMQMKFAGFTDLPVDLYNEGDEPLLYQHIFLVNPHQTLAYVMVNQVPNSLKKRNFLDKINDSLKRTKLDQSHSDYIDIIKFSEKADEIMMDNIELSQNEIDIRQELILFLLLRILYMKAIEDLNWELHLRVYSVKNSNGEPRRLIDFTVSNTEESSNVILTKLDNQGFKRTLRMFDHLKVYVYFRPINHQWVDIEESAFFKCYVNEMTFADLPKIGLSEDKSSLLYAELKKKDYLQGMKKSYKSGFMGSKDAVSNGKLPSAYFVKPVDIEDDNFAKICNKYEIDNNLRIQICEYIMDGQEHSRSNFRYLIAANMPGLKLESQDVNIAGKLNEFTCKIMTGAGKIELSEAKGEKFKYQTKDNNAIIQGYSCGRHTEKEVDAYYDFITQNGCNHTIEDFSYALSILDEASCGRRNRSYWIKAIIEGLMDASLKDRHQPLYVLLKNEYGKVRAKELLSLDPSMIDHAYDKVRNEIERLAQIKFGPVKASTIVTTIVKMATGLG